MLRTTRSRRILKVKDSLRSDRIALLRRSGDAFALPCLDVKPLTWR